MCGKVCSKIEKLSDWNKNWCDNRYDHDEHDDPDDRDKKTKRQKDK